MYLYSPISVSNNFLSNSNPSAVSAPDLQKKVCVWEKRMADIPYTYYLEYYSTRHTSSDENIANTRRLIWNFKDGYETVQDYVRGVVMKTLDETFSSDELKALTFVCIPGATIRRNDIRYKSFSEHLCSDTGMNNGFSHITIIREGIPTHQGGSGSIYTLDSSYFMARKVVLFDDLVTRGRSFKRAKCMLEECGATVICAISLGRTMWSN